MGPEYIPSPGSVAEPGADAPAFGAAVSVASGVPRVDWSSDAGSPKPVVNLLAPQGPGAAESAPAVPKAPEPAAGTKAKRARAWLVAGSVLLALIVAGGGGAVWWLAAHPVAKVVKAPAASPAASSSPSRSVSPSPSATPSATPRDTPPPVQTVTAPAETPTKQHPQTVTITSNSGLWLRSSPTSVDRSNIIGWMPKGSQVSVDSVGDFWWHGTYKGQAGYFASKYTQ